MPKAAKSKVAAPPKPYDDPKKKDEGSSGPIFEAKKKNFSIGGDIQPKVDLSRYVRWPKYVRIQRQRKILYQRLKVPPSINQFTNTLDKNVSINLFKLLHKYRPEDKTEKKERLKELATKKEAGEDIEGIKKAIYIKFGLNHITKLCEQKKAQLVVIANDVDPIELIIWLPAVCRKMDIPYCIVKSQSRLGALVHQKTATALALVSVRPEDRLEFSQLITAIRQQYNENAKQIERTWGGGIMGVKSVAKTTKIERAIAKEAAKKAMM
jgi:large subunit ribosomal protein L7Ae|tara:strand:- start:402 stop:1202 length:801 start_codon:yes stop_codon:yes gene_type:complete